MLSLFWIWFFMFWPSILAGLFWFFHGFRGWFGERRRELTQRKQLAALFASRTAPGRTAIERYVHDDEAYAERVAAFLQHHHFAARCRSTTTRAATASGARARPPVLAQAMVRAVSRARDNELYVILADLAELGHDLAPVVKACRVARSRHHHVIVIVPWPADVPSPDDPDGATPAVDDRRRTSRVRNAVGLPEAEAAKRTRSKRPRRDTAAERSYGRAPEPDEAVPRVVPALRRELGRVGATVMRVNDGDPVQLVLDRLDRLRGMRSRR